MADDAGGGQMTESLFDVVVVGGGVAGCAAAIQLAQRGWKVILCEAGHYPKHKVCGEFLSPECSVLLNELGLTAAIEAVKPLPIHTVAITAPDGTTWETRLPGAGLGISRYRLDWLMAEQARRCGVELREQTTVSNVSGNLDTGFSLTIRNDVGQHEIYAKTVIGAHGKRSRIDRALNRPFLQQSHGFVGLKAHFHGAPLPGRIHLYTFPGGYCGMSEVEGGEINVCLLVRQDAFQQASTIDDFIEWMKQQNPALGKWLSAAQRVDRPWLSIAQVPFTDKRVVENDILMAGDSAGLIAPVAGDGMGMALQASRIAAELLHLFLCGEIDAESVRREYTRRWWRTFGVRMRLSRGLQELMLRPRWLTPGLRVVNGVPALGRLLVAHTRDSHLVRQQGESQ
jgi:menaquinone-9 beta-reductase